MTSEFWYGLALGVLAALGVEFLIVAVFLWRRTVAQLDVMRAVTRPTKEETE